MTVPEFVDTVAFKVKALMIQIILACGPKTGDAGAVLRDTLANLDDKVGLDKKGNRRQLLPCSSRSLTIPIVVNIIFYRSVFVVLEAQMLSGYMTHIESFIIRRINEITNQSYLLISFDHHCHVLSWARFSHAHLQQWCKNF